MNQKVKLQGVLCLLLFICISCGGSGDGDSEGPTNTINNSKFTQHDFKTESIFDGDVFVYKNSVFGSKRISFIDHLDIYSLISNQDLCRLMKCSSIEIYSVENYITKIEMNTSRGLVIFDGIDGTVETYDAGNIGEILEFYIEPVLPTGYSDPMKTNEYNVVVGKKGWSLFQSGELKKTIPMDGEITDCEIIYYRNNRLPIENSGLFITKKGSNSVYEYDLNGNLLKTHVAPVSSWTEPIVSEGGSNGEFVVIYKNGGGKAGFAMIHNAFSNKPYGYYITNEGKELTISNVKDIIKIDNDPFIINDKDIYYETSKEMQVIDNTIHKLNFKLFMEGKASIACNKAFGYGVRDYFFLGSKLMLPLRTAYGNNPDILVDME